MKKLIGTLIAALLVLSSTAALADYDREITFQDIAWETGLDEAPVSLLADDFAVDGFYTYSDSGMFLVPDKDLVLHDIMGEKEDYYSIAVTAAADRYMLKNLRIAGYDVIQLEFFYAMEGEKSHLMTVNVRLDIPDGEAAYKDLTDKLTSVYGDVSKRGKLYTFWETAVWFGQNDTAVMLTLNQGEVKLNYCKIADPTMLDEYLTNLPDPMKDIDSSDISGL